MFTNLTTGIFSAVKNLFSARKITEYDIKKMTKSIQKLLIDSDVSFSVITKLINNIKTKLLNIEIKSNLTSQDMVIKTLEEELTELLSMQNNNRKITHSDCILLCGLQGQGKTTTAAKLANYMKKKDKKVLVTSLDFYRPAAIDQLQTLCKSIDVSFLLTDANKSIKSNLDLINNERDAYDIVIIDTAGRNHIDKEMMMELKNIYHYFTPKEALLVADAMQGQQGIANAREFLKYIKLTGVILSKMDSDGAAGSVLSIESELQIPIKMIADGEKVDRLQEFKVEKIVNRILDKGDVSEILEKVKEVEENSEDLMDNLKHGKITLNDYLGMIKTLKKLGGMSSILSMLPGGQTELKGMLNEEKIQEFYIHEYIISSMTNQEKNNIIILNDSRKNRIAKGSGRSVLEVNKMLKSFKKMKGQIKKFKNFDANNISSMMSNFS